MQCAKIVLSCLFFANAEPFLYSRFHNRKKPRTLPTDSPDRITSWTLLNVFQPADPVAIVSNVKIYIDCSLLCAKHKNCVCTSYIPELKLCLMSSAPIKKFDVAVWDKTLLPAVYTQLINEDGFGSYKTKLLGHGQPPPICGMDAFSNVDSNNRGKRIIDGYTPEPYHMPWIGLLVKDGKARCTAFLVSKNANAKASVWVLSAKHCFNDVLFDEYEDKTINSTSYGLLFGVHDLRFSTQHVIYRTIDELFIYPDEGLKTKDIILIKLDRQIKFNSYINGLCLPDSTEEHTPYEDTPCTTCGFGATKAFPKPVVSSNVVQCIEVISPVSNTDRGMDHSWNWVVKLKAPAFGPYLGDSGSPISCPSSNPWSFLFAIVSAGRSFLFKSTFFVGTRISYFMNFIDESMNRNIVTDEICRSS